jgi:hypothetical protein
MKRNGDTEDNDTQTKRARRRDGLCAGLWAGGLKLGAACQTPTAVLFGPSWEGSWRPWNVSHWLVTPPARSELESLYERIVQACGRRMADITVEQVSEACQQMSLESKRD